MWIGCWMLTGAGSWERGEELGQLEQLERAPAQRANSSYC